MCIRDRPDGTCFEPCNINLLVFISLPTYCTFKHVRYIQQLEIWATALLEEISNIDKFFIFLWMFVYSKETISITVEPRYNETLYNEVLGITNNFFTPVMVRYEKETPCNKTSLIWQTHFASRLPVVKSRFHCTDVSRTFWKNLIGKTGFPRMVFLLLHLACFHPFVTNWSVREFSCILAHK